MTLDLFPVVVNLIYAAMGGLLLLLGGWVTYRFSRLVLGFSIADELKAGNVAVGIAVAGLLLAVGIGLGLVVGLTLN